MRSLRSSGPFVLIDRREQQLSQQQPNSATPAAAEIHETPEAYELVIELPGVDKAAIDVKATDRHLEVKAERRSQRNDPAASSIPPRLDAPLISEFRYGTWSRSFRFPQAIQREQLQAVYRDGLLMLTVPKTTHATVVTVKVED